MTTNEQIEGVKTETGAMLEIIRKVHDTASRAMYCPVTILGVDYKTARHEQLQIAIDELAEILKEDWRYTP